MKIRIMVKPDICQNQFEEWSIYDRDRYDLSCSIAFPNNTFHCTPNKVYPCFRKAHWRYNHNWHNTPLLEPADEPWPANKAGKKICQKIDFSLVN